MGNDSNMAYDLWESLWIWDQRTEIPSYESSEKAFRFTSTAWSCIHGKIGIWKIGHIQVKFSTKSGVAWWNFPRKNSWKATPITCTNPLNFLSVLSIGCVARSRDCNVCPLFQLLKHETIRPPCAVSARRYSHFNNVSREIYRFDESFRERGLDTRARWHGQTGEDTAEIIAAERKAISPISAEQAYFVKRLFSFRRLAKCWFPLFLSVNSNTIEESNKKNEIWAMSGRKKRQQNRKVSKFQVKDTG